jgi:hypothetical protein
MGSWAAYLSTYVSKNVPGRTGFASRIVEARKGGPRARKPLQARIFTLKGAGRVKDRDQALKREQRASRKRKSAGKQA